MVDREKVLAGLTAVKTHFEIKVRGCGIKAEKAKYEERLSVIKDTLELLAPEARVLAVNEVHAHIGEVLWMEVEPDEDGHMISMTPVALDDIRTDMNDDYEEDEYLVFSDGFDPVSQYGHWYRLWTARPTEEQRKAVKWDD